MSSITAASDALKLKRMSNGPDAHAMTVSTVLFKSLNLLTDFT
jgi:hypothetical protein